MSSLDTMPESRSCWLTGGTISYHYFISNEFATTHHITSHHIISLLRQCITLHIYPNDLLSPSPLCLLILSMDGDVKHYALHHPPDPPAPWSIVMILGRRHIGLGVEGCGRVQSKLTLPCGHHFHYKIALYNIELC